jgi:hypothetical protein
MADIAPGGHYRAVSLRAFDPKTRRRAIWWVDGRDPHRLVESTMRAREGRAMNRFVYHIHFEAN